jgi:hypothetical protein
MDKEGILKESESINKKLKDKIEDIEKKPKKARLKFDDNTLLYSENGLKKYYDVLEKTNFKESKNEVPNLNKLIQIFKNWHFMLFPKYDIKYFTNKVNEIGRKKSGKVYIFK